MFGMGFFEIFLVLIVAVIALGPEKLPSAAVEVVKFFKQFKKGVEEAKSTLDNELNISEMKKEADKFKASVSNVTSDITSDINDATQSVNLDLNDLTSLEDDDEISETKKELKEKNKSKQNSKKETVTFDEGKA